jgi:hypothetical protein
MTIQHRAVELRRVDLQITGLVYVRAMRERAGAGPDELARYSAEISRQRRRLRELEGRLAQTA